MPTKQKRKPAKDTRPPGLILRMPPDLQAWLKQQAATEDRAMTRVVLRALNAERAKLEQGEAA
jgi:hypothetical protein